MVLLDIVFIFLIISGLILVPEPYYNEAGYGKHRGSPYGDENSRMYNEMAIIKLGQSMASVVSKPPEVFKEEVREHFKKNGDRSVFVFSSRCCGHCSLCDS